LSGVSVGRAPDSTQGRFLLAVNGVRIKRISYSCHEGAGPAGFVCRRNPRRITTLGTDRTAGKPRLEPLIALPRAKSQILYARASHPCPLLFVLTLPGRLRYTNPALSHYTIPCHQLADALKPKPYSGGGAIEVFFLPLELSHADRHARCGNGQATPGREQEMI